MLKINRPWPYEKSQKIYLLHVCLLHQVGNTQEMLIYVPMGALIWLAVHFEVSLGLTVALQVGLGCVTQPSGSDLTKASPRFSTWFIIVHFVHNNRISRVNNCNNRILPVKITGSFHVKFTNAQIKMDILEHRYHWSSNSRSCVHKLSRIVLILLTWNEY